MAETETLRIPIGLDTKDVQADAKALKKEIEDAFDSSAMQEQNKQLQSVANSMKQTYDKAVQLSDELDRLKSIEIPTDDYVEIQKQIDRDTAALQKLANKMYEFKEAGGDTRSDVFHKMEAQADELRNSIEYAEGELQDLVDTGKAFTIGDPEKIARVEKQLGTVNDQLKIQLGNYNDITNKTEEQSKSHTKIFDIVKQVTTEVKKQPSLMKKTASFIKQAATFASKLAGHIKKVASHGSSATDSFKRLAKTMLGVTLGAQGIVSMLRKIVSLGKEGFGNLTKESKEAAYNLNLLTGKFMQLKNSVGAALSPLVSMVTPVITRIIDLFTKAFNAVAMFFGALSGKSTIMVAKSMGADEGAAINAGSSSSSKKKTPEEKYQEAVAKAQAKYDKDLAKYQEKVAKNEEKQAKAAAKLAKEQEKANGQLASFDELNNLSIDTMDDAIDTMDEFSLEEPVLELPDMEDFLDDSVGSGLGPMFEEMEIDSKFKDLVDWLKDMWDKADFTELGKKAGEALKKFLDDVPWDKIQENAEKVGKSLATLINGFVEVEGLGDSIGKTFAEGLNTIFYALDGFVSNLHWDSVGRFIADTLNGWFENIDWEKIRHTFVTGFRGLADAISAFIEEFHWDNLSTAISNAVNIVIESLYEFFSNIDFYELAYNIQTQITKTIEKIDWEKIGETLGTILQSAIDFLKGLIDAWEENDTGTKIKEAIKNFIKGVIEKVDFHELGEVLGKLLQGAINALKDLIAGWNDSETGQGIQAALKDFFKGLCENIDLGEAALILAGIFATKVAAALIPALAKKGLSSMMSNLFTKEAADTATTTAVSGAGFGLGSVFASAAAGGMAGVEFLKTKAGQIFHNWSNWAYNEAGFADMPVYIQDTTTNAEVFAQAWNQVQQGLLYTNDDLQKMQDNMGLTAEQAQQLNDAMFENNTELAEFRDTQADALGQSELWEMAAGDVKIYKEAVEQIKDGHIKNKEELKYYLEYAQGGTRQMIDDNDQLYTLLSEHLTNTSAQYEETTTKIDGMSEATQNETTSFQEMDTQVNTSLTNMDTALVNHQTVLDQSKTSVTDLGTTYQQTGTDIDQVVSKSNTWGSNMITNIVNGISKGLPKLTSAVKSILTTIEKTIDDIIDKAVQWGKDIAESIAKGIEAGIEKIKSAVNRIASTIKSYLHFSEPDVGPLSNFHTFMPDMIDSMVQGIEQGIPDVQRALDKLSYGIAGGTQLSPNMQRSMAGGNNSQMSAREMYDVMRRAMTDAMQSSDKNNEDIVIQIDQTEVFRAVKDESNIYNKQTGLPAFA